MERCRSRGSGSGGTGTSSFFCHHGFRHSSIPALDSIQLGKAFACFRYDWLFSLGLITNCLSRRKRLPLLRRRPPSPRPRRRKRRKKRRKRTRTRRRLSTPRRNSRKVGDTHIPTPQDGLGSCFCGYMLCGLRTATSEPASCDTSTTKL